MINDPISDMLTRLRNAVLVKKNEVRLPFSKMKMTLAEIFVKKGYLAKAEKVGSGLSELCLTLKYENGRAKITALTRISRPGRRIYADKDHLPKVQNDLGLAVISTSQGLMTNKEARRKKIGGEIICEIF